MKIKKITKIIQEISETAFFQQSFTHLSFCHERNLPASASYENLEFLGDSILSFETCLFIYNKFPEFNEGKMSKLKQLMVQERTLAAISKEIGLTNYINLGTGEKKNNGLFKDGILADVFESFLAALLLTKGRRQVQNFLTLTVFEWIKGKEEMIWDYKTQLQEYCQANKNYVTYRMLENRRKKEKEFFFLVNVEDKLKSFSEEGSGRTRKSAEQEAAANALKKLGVL